jgi:uncharacterized protein involved in exopolysaccharide biosynthesis
LIYPRGIYKEVVVMDEPRKDTFSAQPVYRERGQHFDYERQINLRDYFNVIVRRKRLIIELFIIFVVVSAVISLFQSKVYKATASIMIMPSRVKTALSPTDVSLDTKETEGGEYIEQRPSISIATHKALVKSNAVLERVTNRLRDDGILKKAIPVESFRQQLGVENTENTNILQLSVTNTNPDRAGKIANTWAEEYVRYSSEIILGEVRGSGDFIFEQFKQAEENLAQAEQAVRDFDVREDIALMEIELKENQSQLQGHYAKIYSLEFQLAEKKNRAEQIFKELDEREELSLQKLELDEKRGQLMENHKKIQQFELVFEQKEELLQKTNDEIAAMTKDGIWIGSFSVREAGTDYFFDNTLSPSQSNLRQRVLESKLFLEQSRDKRDSFINSSKINLTREEIGRRREQLLGDKVLLTNLKQLSEATGANLKSKAGLSRLEQLKGPIAERLSDLTVWEILSLMEGYNFFETRERFLEQKLEQQATHLAAMEEAQTRKENELKVLEETVDRAEAIYGFYRDKFKSLEKQKASLELETAGIEFELTSSRKLAERLEKDVKTLQMIFDKERMVLGITGVDPNGIETGNIEFELSYSRGLVKELEEKVRSLKVNINAKKAKLEQLNRDLEVCRRTYNLLISKIEEARIAKSMELGEVKVVSSAFEPKYPIGPNRRKNVAVAGAAGLFFGIFAAFFQEFWTEGRKEEKAKHA